MDGRSIGLWPLYAAGFTTAFGAHGIAASLGAGASGHVLPLLTLGVLLGLHDGAEIVLNRSSAPWPTGSAHAGYCSAA